MACGRERRKVRVVAGKRMARVAMPRWGLHTRRWFLFCGRYCA